MGFHLKSADIDAMAQTVYAVCGEAAEKADAVKYHDGNAKALEGAYDALAERIQARYDEERTATN